MTDRKKYYGYIGLRKDEEGALTSCAMARDLDDLRTSLVKPESSERNKYPAEKAELDKQEHQTLLAKTMTRVVDSSHSQYELLFISSLLRPVYMGMMLSREIASSVEKLDSCLEDAGNVMIYGLSEEMFRRMPAKFEKLERVERGLAALPAALLMSIVATFDSNVADIVRDMLTLKSGIFQTGSKTILLSDVLQAESIAEIREKSISDEIYQLSRGSHEDQVQYIESNFHISIKGHWKRWADFIEVFERRNLIAHGEKTFTKRYVSICLKHGHKGSEKTLGTAVDLTESYLRQAADLLLEFEILLVFSLWRKQFSAEEQDAFANLNQVGFKLIENKNYRVAIRVLEYALELKNVRVEDAIKKMMFVNLASAHRHVNDKERCLRILEQVDWSASSDNYKLCVAALRENVSEVTDLMGPVVGAGKITKADLREWPVFDFVRADEKFSAKFLEIFEEPLREAGQAKAMEFSEQEPTSTVSSDGATVH